MSPSEQSKALCHDYNFSCESGKAKCEDVLFLVEPMRIEDKNTKDLPSLLREDR